jgi:rhomboid protease GluP
MDVQLIVAYNLMAIAAIVGAFGAPYLRRGGTPWILVNGVTLVLGVLAIAFIPQWAGVVVAALFMPLVLAPLLFSRLSLKSARRGDSRGAARYARLAALCHPSSAARFNAALMGALANTEPAQRSAALMKLARRVDPQRRPMVERQILIEDDKWEELLSLMERSGETSPDTALLRVRALGETGRIDEMAKSYAQSKLAPQEIGLARLFLLSYAGRRKSVESLLLQPSPLLNVEQTDYLKAIAALNGGAVDAGRKALETLAYTAQSSRVRLAARRHAAQIDARGAAAPLAPETLSIVEQAERVLAKDAPRRAMRWSRARVTLALVALNLVAFAAELAYGGSQNAVTLAKLGALWTPFVLQQGELWRLLTATFLHYGAAHLVINLFGLALIGRLIEASFGSLRMAAIYLSGALISSTCVLVFGLALHDGQQLYVGASGAIFALFGAETALAVHNWRSLRDASDRLQLAVIVLVLVIQVLYDAFMPINSMTAHVCGFLTGMAFGALLAPRIAPPRKALVVSE